MTSVYTSVQISDFLTHIGLPESQHARYSGDATRDLRLLNQLHTHTISTIPYENLTLHYSASHKISTDPHVTYRKIVTNRRGRGGYCMENSILYNHILRGLGFPVYTASVRIRHRKDGVPQGPYIGWVHIVNIVTLSNGDKYMVDVGFGGDGATRPLPLVEDHPQQNLGSQENRLVKDWIPAQTQRTPQTRLWIYQYRNGTDKEWNSFYAFAEVEATEPDFYIMNWYTGSHPESFQTFTPLVVKFLRRAKEGGDGEQEIYGKRLLVYGTVKENLGGKTKVVKECLTDEERLAALSEWFGMAFTEEERKGIVGYVSELKA